MLRDAVLDLVQTMSGRDADEVYSALYARLKGRFIDFEPGPDIRRYADAIARGDFDTNTATAATDTARLDIAPSEDETTIEVNDG